ncbi:MAG: prolyl oligopeptidase family serine peptidase [Terricaulis sp.]
MMKRVAAFIFGALLLCVTPAVAAPLQAYSRLPAIADVAISDDGQMIAYIASRNEQQTVVVRQIGGDVLQSIALNNVKLRGVQWAGSDYVIIEASTTEAVRNVTRIGEMFQAVSLNIRTGETAQFVSRSRGDQSYLNVLMGGITTGIYEGEPVAYVMALAASESSIQWRYDLVRVNLRNGWTYTHQMGGETARDFLVRQDGAVLARENYDQEQSRWTLAIRQGSGWREVQSLNIPIDTPGIAGFSSDGSALLERFFDEEGQVWRARPISLSSGEIGAPLQGQGDDTIVFNRSGQMVGQIVSFDPPRYAFLDRGLQENWDGIIDAFQGAVVRLVSATPDFSRLVVRVEGRQFSGDYFLFDAAAGRLSPIGASYPEIPSAELAEVRAIRYAAADGLSIGAYLTLPVGREPRNLPLIVMPHGGPQSRDNRGFNWLSQALASRGYAVLQPNFRGSSGEGRAFVEAAYGEWGRKMQTDLSDGVAYLAAEGIADPQRVCILGGSYGGYAAIAGVTLQQGIYRCAVAIAGVFDLEEMLDPRVIGTRSSTMRYWTRYMAVDGPGDPRLDAISTVRAAANGNAPVLLIHGRDDTVAQYSQSTAMESALRRAGRSVELVQLRAEDHWLSSGATRTQALTAAVNFLERNNPPN